MSLYNNSPGGSHTGSEDGRIQSTSAGIGRIIDTLSREGRRHFAMPMPQIEVAVDALVEQAEELCTIHDHITRVIAALDVSQGSFSDQYGRTSTRANLTTANSTAD